MAGAAAYTTAFVEGLVEPISVAVISSLVVAFANALENLPGASPEILLEYMGCVFLITLAVNFFKGLIAPGVAGASAIGMLLGLIFFGSAISGIAPEAAYEIIAYIIAAILGMYFGVTSFRR